MSASDLDARLSISHQRVAILEAEAAQRAAQVAALEAELQAARRQAQVADAELQATEREVAKMKQEVGVAADKLAVLVFAGNFVERGVGCGDLQQVCSVRRMVCSVPASPDAEPGAAQHRRRGGQSAPAGACGGAAGRGEARQGAHRGAHCRAGHAAGRCARNRLGVSPCSCQVSLRTACVCGAPLMVSCCAMPLLGSVQQATIYA